MTPFRCKLFGHRWRCHSIELPIFMLYCQRCGAERQDAYMQPEWSIGANFVD